MNLEKLSKKIRREMSRSPKKTAILGLMTLVAVYFWVPIIGGWVKKEETSQPAPPPVATKHEPSLTEPEEQTSPTRRYSWHQIEDWMKNDPAREPTQALTSLRHPFVDLERLAQAEREKVEADDRADKPFAVEKLDLKLTNTVVGSRNRHATISSRVYKEGDHLWLIPPNSTTKKPVETDIVVRNITTTSVQLAQEDFELTLTISGTSLATGDWISPRSQAEQSPRE